MFEIDIGEITIFCYLNYIFEWINEFNIIKNPKALQLYRFNHLNLKFKQFFMKF